MSIAIGWKVYAVGHCTHPACLAWTGGSCRSQAFPALAFRLHHPDHGHILFDTGYAQHFMQATARWPERLYRAVTPVHWHPRQALAEQLRVDGIEPDAIAGIVLSHLHGDHIGGLRDFPHVPVWCARAAMADLRARGRLSALRIGLLPGLLPEGVEARCRWLEDAPRVALPPPLDAFDTGHDLLGDGSLLAIALPGHAAGHYGLLFHDGSSQVFLIADAVWSLQALRQGRPPPRLTRAWLGDAEAWLHTFERLHALASAPACELRLVASHDPESLDMPSSQRMPTTTGRRSDPSLR